MPNETLHELSTLLQRAASELRASAPTESRNGLIADIEKTAKAIDEKKTVVAQAISDASQRMKEAHALAVELARLGCASEEKHEAIVRIDEKARERRYRIWIAIVVLLATMVFGWGLHSIFMPSVKPQESLCFMFGLIVCWTAIVTVCLAFLGRAKSN